MLFFGKAGFTHLRRPQQVVPEKMDQSGGLQLECIFFRLLKLPELSHESGNFRIKGIIWAKAQMVRRLGTGEGADILTAQQGILRKKTGMEQDAEIDTFLTAAGISIMHPPGIDEETVSFL